MPTPRAPRKPMRKMPKSAQDLKDYARQIHEGLAPQREVMSRDVGGGYKRPSNKALLTTAGAGTVIVGGGELVRRRYTTKKDPVDVGKAWYTPPKVAPRGPGVDLRKPWRDGQFYDPKKHANIRNTTPKAKPVSMHKDGQWYSGVGKAADLPFKVRSATALTPTGRNVGHGLDLEHFTNGSASPRKGYLLKVKGTSGNRRSALVAVKKAYGNGPDIEGEQARQKANIAARRAAREKSLPATRRLAHKVEGKFTRALLKTGIKKSALPTKITSVTPRTPQGKYVSHENDVQVFHPKFKTVSRMPRKNTLGHWKKGRDSQAKGFVAKADVLNPLASTMSLSGSNGMGFLAANAGRKGYNINKAVGEPGQLLATFGRGGVRGPGRSTATGRHAKKRTPFGQRLFGQKQEVPAFKPTFNQASGNIVFGGGKPKTQRFGGLFGRPQGRHIA